MEEDTERGENMAGAVRLGRLAMQSEGEST